MNVGAIFRTAHAFGASFVFTVRAAYDKDLGKRADTSATEKNLPFYAFPSVDDMLLPKGCQVVGVELTDDAVDLPSFHHPAQAAYILGPERASLSDAMQARCDHMLKIPTAFCLNVSLAAAIVMYDRTIQLGRFAPRPVWEGAPREALPEHVSGGPIIRTGDPAIDRLQSYAEDPPSIDAFKDRFRST